MAVSYVQKEIGNGIMFSGIYDAKFKSDFVSIRFVTPLNEKMSPRLSLLSMILGTSNKFITSRTKLNEELIGLYDSLMSVFSYSVGDYQISGLTRRIGRAVLRFARIAIGSPGIFDSGGAGHRVRRRIRRSPNERFGA